MELNEFVKLSLLHIFEGISEAQKEITEKYEGLINPVYDNNVHDSIKLHPPSVLSKEHLIKFDIAIQASEKENSQAGLTVFSGFLGAGAKAGIEFHDATTSRIQFEIPVKFPAQVENDPNFFFSKHNNNLD